LPVREEKIRREVYKTLTNLSAFPMVYFFPNACIGIGAEKARSIAFVARTGWNRPVCSFEQRLQQGVDFVLRESFLAARSFAQLD
jgi:hypothetical protein